MCAGTNHQDIQGVTKVVFFGDSVTQGTPNDEHLLCVDNEHFYRNRLAEFLADHFGLDRGNGLDWAAWKTYSCQYNGEPGRVESGDFKNCAKWGARTDDLLGETSCGRYNGDERARCCEVCCHGGTCGDGGQCIRAAGSPETDAFCGRSSNKQVDQCVPEGQSPEVPLFVFTMGGNDIAAISQDGSQIDPNTPEGMAEIEAGYPSMWALAHRTIDYLEEALRFMKDPARFPNGSYVVFANPFEFTDGTGDVGACQPEVIEIPLTPDFSLRLDLTSYGIPLAELAGFGDWARPEVQQEIVVWILEQYMRLAVEFQVDLAWMLESFCGHGYVATGADADMSNRCYRPDDPSRWFDVTCIHPNERGHTEIFKLLRALVLE
jgi:lysophospholipase L1-like esterase